MAPEPRHRRGQAVYDRILDATLQLLAEDGYRFSIDDVAQRAGVHKTTIYRRWATKAALVAAAVGRLADLEIPPPRTDDPTTELTRLALAVARALRTGAGTGALRAVLAAAVEDPEIVPIARQFLSGRYEIAVAIIEQAIASGEYRDDIDPTIVWEAIVNPLHVRAILGAPASDNTARQLVKLALAGASAGSPAARQR